MRFALLLLVLLAACGRPLSPGETALAQSLFGDELNPKPVRIASFKALSKVTAKRPKRPRVACREKIWPEPTTDIVTTFTAAFVTFNRINMADELYRDDYLPDHPKRISLPAAMLIGHELTHVWQWQNRDRTGYHPLKAAAEHRPGTDPYLLDLTAGDFLSHGFEQQGAIVEEYVCCRALDPQGARTQRLHQMLSATFPVQRLEDRLKGVEIGLPWAGVQPKGICS